MGLCCRGARGSRARLDLGDPRRRRHIDGPRRRRFRRTAALLGPQVSQRGFELPLLLDQRRNRPFEGTVHELPKPGRQGADEFFPRLTGQNQRAPLGRARRPGHAALARFRGQRGRRHHRARAHRCTDAGTGPPLTELGRWSVGSPSGGSIAIGSRRPIARRRQGRGLALGGASGACVHNVKHDRSY